MAILKEVRPGVRVFLDREALGGGMAWADEIYRSLERSRYVAALLSPDYLVSNDCQREFGMAELHGDRTDRLLLQPIYVFSADLPTRYAIYHYTDAREADHKGLLKAASAIARLLDKP